MEITLEPLSFRISIVAEEASNYYENRELDD